MVKINQESKTVQYKILKNFTKHKTWLSHFFDSMVSDPKYESVHGKEHLSDLARVAKVSDHTSLKILNPKQILPRL